MVSRPPIMIETIPTSLLGLGYYLRRGSYTAARRPPGPQDALDLDLPVEVEAFTGKRPPVKVFQLEEQLCPPSLAARH